jgi:hypothetical protein
MNGYIFCTNIYSRCPQYLPWRIEFEKLMLSETAIRTFHEQFNRLKTRNKIGVDVTSLLDMYKIPSSSACREVFCVDSDCGGEVDFRTFVLCVWNICTQSDESIGQYFYFTINPSNFLTVDYVHELLRSAPNNIAAMCIEIFGDRLRIDPKLTDM